MPNSRLQFLIDNLQESLDVEVKNWLNGLADNGDKASLAKEIIALANSGGGYIFIGFDDEGTDFTELEPQEGELQAFTQDAIASVIQRYVTPPCQCRIELISKTGSKNRHPVIVVPGNHRTPLFAARGGPDGELQSSKVYVRRPGGNSEQARTQDDWEKLIERIVKARQSEMLFAIREVLEPSTHNIVEEANTLEKWRDENIYLWEQIVGAFDGKDPRRLVSGYWTVSFVMSPFEKVSLSELNSTLEREIPAYSGWPPFTYLHRSPVRPHAQGDFISAYLGALEENEKPEDRVERSDYWRISRDGRGFMLRPMQEDHADYVAHIKPRPEGPFFDWTTPIYRMTEILKFIQILAEKYGYESTSFKLLVSYHNAAGRRLQQHNRLYTLHDGAICHNPQPESSIEGLISEIDTNIEELIYSLLAPIYEQFSFTELPRVLVNKIVAEVLGYRRYL